jgi:phosphoglycerate dehydrogenase-like enzyme
VTGSVDAADRRRRARLLVHSDRAALFLDRIIRDFSGVEVDACDSYAGIDDALRRTRPEIVLSHKFEDARYPGETVAGFESVRWIHCGGTGVDHFWPWDESRLTVTNSPGIAAQVMAEYAIGAIYALNLHFPRYMRQQHRHEWVRGTVRQTEGGTIAVIGLGRIGRAICARAKAAGLTVIGVRSGQGHVEETDRTLGADRLREALAAADYVVVIVPHTSRTTNLLDAAALAAMKRGAFLVNLSRGGIVDEAALVEALRKGQIGGAVLDVFADEPLPPDSAFWDLENLLVTPHSAGFVEGWETPVAELFCRNLDRWLRGAVLENIVDPEPPAGSAARRGAASA